ncbi:TniQ family protein [Streptosporangium canum]|uniref:TniQ family protein n=1 Tax=Streptosporangium canum TaxID=324952 RepID=UPI0034187E99
MGAGHPLPCSLAPLPDESLPGYILRLSYRLGLSPLQLLVTTGLGVPHARSGRSIRQGLMMNLAPERIEAFAHATRLQPEEIAHLCLSSLATRCPWANIVETTRRNNTHTLSDPWIFTTASRYCPQCLAGDGSPIQDEYGGAWRRLWRLPVVFSCPTHQRLLEHLCPQCRRPALAGTPGTPSALIPLIGNHGIHPAGCRAALRQARRPTERPPLRHPAIGPTPRRLPHHRRRPGPPKSRPPPVRPLPRAPAQPHRRQPPSHPMDPASLRRDVRLLGRVPARRRTDSPEAEQSQHGDGSSMQTA